MQQEEEIMTVGVYTLISKGRCKAA